MLICGFNFCALELANLQKILQNNYELKFVAHGNFLLCLVVLNSNFHTSQAAQVVPIVQCAGIVSSPTGIEEGESPLCLAKTQEKSPPVQDVFNAFKYKFVADVFNQVVV